MPATPCIQACGEDDLLRFKGSIEMGKKGDLSDFERGCWCVSQLIYWDFHHAYHDHLSGFALNGAKKEKIPSEQQLRGG